MLAWLAIGCSTSSDKSADPADPATSAPPTSETTSPTPEPTTTGPAPCEADESLTLAVATSQPWKENEVRFEVTASSPTTIAVACTLDADPTEVHLVESTVEGMDHELRFAGLLADSDYTCAVAAVCPATSAATVVAVRTAPPVDGLVKVETTTYGAAGSEYVLFNTTIDCFTRFQRLNVMDRQGRMRWWYATPLWVGPSVEFRYHGDNQFQWGGGWGPNPLGSPRQMDLFDGERYDAAADLPDAAQSDFHHDGKQLPDGRLLTLERETTSDGFDGFRVRRIDPATGVVDFDYSSQRAYDEGHLPRGDGDDPWHANWVDIVDGTLYVSLCFLQEVVAIDVATGDWEWTFGAGGDFALSDAGGNPLSDDEFTQCQHGLEYTSDDHLLVYDNGVNRRYSRASQYTLDPVGRTATLDWTWTEPDWFETTLGDADYLPDGRVLLNQGHSDCFSSNPGDRTTIVEIDPATGEKLWQLRYVQRNQTAYRADWAGGCDLFANTAVCPALADRLADLQPLLAQVQQGQ